MADNSRLTRITGLPHPATFKSLEDAQRAQEELYRALSEWRVDIPRPNQLMSGLFIRPEWYGAMADGVNDDTTAIQDAITEACRLCVPLVFSSGTYLISPTGTDPKRMFYLSSGIRIYGAGKGRTTLKVKNSAGSYNSIFYPLGNTATTDLSGLEISHLTIDHNIDNNALPSGGSHSLVNDCNASISLYYGTGMHIHDIEIKNSSPVNGIIMNGRNIFDSSIRNCEFTNIGEDPNSVVHDASFIYIHATNCEVSGCQYETAAQNSSSGGPLVETHGSYIKVHHNRIKNCGRGMNICGISWDDCWGLEIYDNIITGVRAGIILYSSTYTTEHTSGWGIDGCIVRGNYISLAGGGVYTLDSNTPEMGIGVYSGWYLGIRGLIVDGNIIDHPQEDSDITNTTYSAGLAFVAQQLEPTVESIFQSSKITNNIVMNMPMPGLHLKCTVKDVDVSGNVFINCGSTQDTDINTLYRRHILFDGNRPNGLFIHGNYFADNFDTTRVASFIYLLQSASTDPDNNISMIGNKYTSSGSDTSALLQQIFINNTSGILIPYVSEHIENFRPTTLSSQKYANGSRVYDAATGKLYQIAANQYTWTDISRDQGVGTYDGPTFNHLHVTNSVEVGTTITADAVYLSPGLSRVIVATANDGSIFLGGGSSYLTGGCVQLYGGGSGSPGDIYHISGTNASAINSKIEFGHRTNSGYVASAKFDNNKVLTQYTGSAPSSSATDGFLQYSADFAAGNACPTFRTENGTVIVLNQDLKTTATPTFAGASFTDQPRTATSLYRRYYHIPLGSSNPGASGATWVDADANTTGGWQLNAAGEKIRGGTDIHADWDGASDMKVEVRFNVNVDNTGGAAGDTVDLKLVCYYKGIGDTATKTQTVEVPTTVGASARYKAFKADFTLNWDETSNVLEVGDHISFYLNLETDTSEVDDVIITGMSFSYLTTHIGIEDGDE